MTELPDSKKFFDVAVLGGGIVGAATFYTLAKYTNLKSLVLIEKYSKLGLVNTGSLSNSQTLHFGDIETNYTLKRAQKVKVAAQMVARYVESLPKSEQKIIFKKFQKMVIGVGAAESEIIRQRFAEFKALFPKQKMLDAKGIASHEPAVMAGRNPALEMAAIISDDGYTLDYAALAESFAARARQIKDKEARMYCDTKVTGLKKIPHGYEIYTNRGLIRARTVVAALGAHSLLFAKSLGYGREYLILPIVGNFFCAGRKILNGKVYTIQQPKLPFAAIHGDPGFNDPDETSFGPTAKALPILERRRPRTFFEFIKSAGLDFSAAKSLISILKDPIVFKFVATNFLFDLPLIGNWAFVKSACKIVPNLKPADFKGGRVLGGIRPQLVNKKTNQLLLGTAEIEGENIIFNVTPSPGATACLKTAQSNTQKVISFWGRGAHFNETQFSRDLIL